MLTGVLKLSFACANGLVQSLSDLMLLPNQLEWFNRNEWKNLEELLNNWKKKKSQITGKSVFEVFDQVGLKLACLATESSQSL